MAIPQSILAEKKAIQDTNDCTVIAVAIATGKSYKEVHEVFRLSGRKPKRGCTTWMVEKVLFRLGYHVEKLETWRGKTCATLSLPRQNNYIAFTTDHALAVKFGLIKDWTDGKRNRIKEVWEISAKYRKI
tara:strand:- start:2030 stop:2419 length:390 start_codon:yes stop_codon:yes gene_type:complete